MSDDLELARRALAGNPEATRAIDVLIEALPVSDDARQLVRQRVLVDGKLRHFDGRGPLRLWLKTVGARIEVDLRRGEREEAVEDRVLAALLPSSAHREQELITLEARHVLQASVRHALRELAERDRLFVQHYYLDGLTLTAIADLYQVAPSTVMRAVNRALEALRELVRQHLMAHHQLGLATLVSLVRVGVV